MKWDLDLCSEFLYQTGESPERKRIVAAESGPQEEIKPPEDGDEQFMEKESMGSSSRQQVSSDPVGVAPKSSLSGGMGKQAVSPDSQKGQRVSFAESSRVFQKTRRCPACESGMDAPGSRHNAECKRRRKAFEAQNGPESASSPSASTEINSPSTPERFVDAPVDGGTSTHRKESETRIDVDGDTHMPEVEISNPTPVGDMEPSSVGDDRKRTADVDVSDLEKQIREDPMMDSLFVHQEPEWCCSMSCQPLQHLGETDENGFQRITSPELFSSDETVSAIQFRPDTRHESVTLRLGGGKVKVWRPDTIIDDQTLESLDTSLGYEGMQEEVNNLEACQTGDLLSEAEAKAVQKVNKSARVIGARWVCAFKSAIRVSQMSNCRERSSSWNKCSKDGILKPYTIL